MKGRNAWLGQLTAISVGLALLVWCLYGQTLGHQFVNFDDQSYVYANPVISRGLSWASIGWAFTHQLSHNWHPLTAISHLLDCQLFDLKPGGHHFTNVLFHSISAILLMLALFNITGAFWRSGFVAAVFAVHPLHVESVAWISERKDVLSGLFFMLTLIAYGAYVRRPSIGRYLLMSILGAGGLMAKPMLVTLPIVLLLLDYWPLERFAERSAKASRLFLEKVPLLILASTVALITIVIQQRGIRAAENISLPWRIGNALVSAAIYVRQSVWPFGLAVFYPHAGSNLPLWQIAIAFIFLIALTSAAWLLRRTYPYFLCGWFWYLVMLTPVIGVVQVGDQAHADRYMYLPQIGLAIAATWGIFDLAEKRRIPCLALAGAAAGVLGLFVWRTVIQTSYWRDSESLWNHTLAVTQNNDLAHERLASAFLDKGRPDDAILQAQLAINVNQRNGSAENDMGAALARRGQPQEALRHFSRALELDPNLSTIHYNIANAQAAGGNIAEAIAEYGKQLVIDPGSADTHNNLGLLLVRTGRIVEAEGHLTKAVSLKPNLPEAHNNLAIVFSQEGKMDEAIAEWNKTLLIDPNNLEAHANLAWVLATSSLDSIRNGSAALDHAWQALKLSGESNPRIWRLVAVGQGEVGQFDAAVESATKALALAEQQNNSALAQTLKGNIQSLRDHMPVRDSAQQSR